MKKVRARQPEMILPRPLQVGAAVLVRDVARLLPAAGVGRARHRGGRRQPVAEYVRVRNLLSAVVDRSTRRRADQQHLGCPHRRCEFHRLLAVGTAYCLVRFTFLGRPVILRSLVALQALPGTMLLLPLFVIFSTAQSYLGLQVVGTRGG